MSKLPPNKTRSTRERCVRSKAQRTVMSVFRAICDHDNGAPNYCYASMACIAAQCNTSRSAVHRCINKLIEMEEVEDMGLRKGRGKHRDTKWLRVRDEVLFLREPRWDFDLGKPNCSHSDNCSHHENNHSCSHTENSQEQMFSQRDTKESILTSSVLRTEESKNTCAGENFSEIDHAHEEWLQEVAGK